MVIRDPFESPRQHADAKNRGRTHVALPTDRLASHVADFILLAPVMALAMSPFRRSVTEARLLDRLADSHFAIFQSLLVAVVIGILWETLFIAFWGTTPGRAIFGLRIVDVWTGEKPRLFNSFLRALTWWGSVPFMGAPFFGVYSNPRRRPLHDRAADTEVRSINTKRQSATPKISELAAGSILTSMTMVFATFVLLSQITLMRERSKFDEIASSPKLCEEVSDAQSAWVLKETAPTRIHVALSLSAAGYIDNGCLETEADYALWNDGGRVLGYLAKGLTRFQNEPFESEQYFAKVCDVEPDSDACRIVGWYRGLSEFYEGREIASLSNADQDEIESSEIESSEIEINEAELSNATLSQEPTVDDLAPTNKVGGERVDTSVLTEKIESLARSLLPQESRNARSGSELPDWLRLLVIRELFQMKAEPELILRMAKDPARHLAVGAKLLEYRARALWRLGQKEQSKATVFSSADALPPRSRVVVTSWLCNRELYESGDFSANSECTADAMRACEMMQNSADIASGDYSIPSFILASARHAECRIRQGRGTSSLLTSLSEHVVEAPGKDLFESIRLMRSSEYKKGIELLRKVASTVVRPEGQASIFVTEANIRLIEEVSRQPRTDKVAQSEIFELKERWFKSPNARRYGDWGRALFEGLNRRGDWRSAAEVGVLLGSEFEFEYDQNLRAKVAIAAWRAGKTKLATEILENSESTRLPASLTAGANSASSTINNQIRNASDREILENIRRSGGRR